MEFYSPDIQTIAGPVRILPQKGSVSGGTGRPVNSYAILRDGHSILVDAPFSWCLDGIADLAAGGYGPGALVLSHKDLCASGDAFEELTRRYDLSVLLHPADQDAPEAVETRLAFEDPVDHPLLKKDGIEVIEMPGHTPGSILLYLAEADGILLAGDSAVGPGPEQPADPPRLERPKMDEDDDKIFCAAWPDLLKRRPVAAVLPLHGQIYRRQDLGADRFIEVLAHIWTGAPMDPSGG
ncbi:MBL fold metallo-hydrolase [Aestuariibius sp. 2305UL40-4]|uniref:MBL fold metallo-hydrolase n=1 Tax=Aestuariibius violaceus TaxID=3234132 RepID=UPI00345EB9AA